MITIIDYGLGNIRAFENVYKRLNISTKVAKNKNDLIGAKKIILPGVGAFDHAMTLLNNSGMREKLEELVLGIKIPVIGICVGMQILANKSDEGKLEGLGWVNAQVKKFEYSELPPNAPLPHMGWNNILPMTNSELMNGLNNESRFYFLHSYYFETINDENIIAQANYGINFTCAIKSDNIYGVQFHPEKSHHNGIQLLKNFGML